MDECMKRRLTAGRARDGTDAGARGADADAEGDADARGGFKRSRMVDETRERHIRRLRGTVEVVSDRDDGLGDGGGDAGERAGIAEVGGYSSMSRRFGKSAKRDAGGDRNLARERTRRRRGRSTAVGARRVAHSGHAERAVPRPDGKCITKSERVLFEHQRWSEGTERKIR